MSENSATIRSLSLMKGQGNKGFTLVELLVVIAVLAILVTAVLPFGGRMMDNTKKEKTVQLLESIRFGLIGAEYAYDANGNRVIGGYIGDFDELPDLITHYWSNSSKKWVIQYYSSTSSSGTTEYIPQTYDEDLDDDYSTPSGSDIYTETEDKFNQNAMPLALWTNYVSVNGTYQEIVDKDDWQGPYVVQTRDDFTNDDDVFSYYEVTSNESPADKLGDDLDEMRKFWLRQGGGRLIDGWGSALLFYMDDEDLYVVSAGSDRKINYGYYYLDDTKPYDNGPVDTSLSGNEDNIVMVLTKEQWDLTNQKASITRLKLQDLKAGIIGQRGNVTGGVKQPNGFVADIGGLETLVGSYVYKSGVTDKVYKCLRRHTNTSTSSIELSNTNYWYEDSLGTVTEADGTTRDESIEIDYPFATLWQSSFARTYYEAQPQLILMNADYVYTEDDETGDKTYYRYVNNEDKSGTFVASYWAEDDTFAGHDWVKEHDDLTSGPSYTSEILNPWTYYSSVEFGAGWRGPYTSYTSDPLTDGWGRQIYLEMDKGSLVLRSYGPDGLTGGTYEDDDITETIAHSDYAVPATVRVYEEDADSSASTAAVTMTETTGTEDYVSVYSAFNGGVGYFNALINSIDSTSSATSSGIFNFTSAVGHESGPFAVDGSAVTIVDGIETDEPTGDGVWLPIGKVMVVYRSASYVSGDGVDTSDDITYASPHSDTFSGSSTGDAGPLGYQRTFLIHSRTNPELVLGEE